MKERKKLDLLRNIDPKFIEEADPTRPISHGKSTIRTRRTRTALVAACVSIVLILTTLLVLFVPYNHTPPSVSQYEDSEYYGLIQALNGSNYTPPNYKNNFERLWSFGKSLFKNDSDMTYSDGKGDSYIEIPNDGMPHWSAGILGDDYKDFSFGAVEGTSDFYGIQFRPLSSSSSVTESPTEGQEETFTAEEITTGEPTEEVTGSGSNTEDGSLGSDGATEAESESKTETPIEEEIEDMLFGSSSPSPDINDLRDPSVSEIDIIKRSQTHVFYFSPSGELRAYKPDGEHTSCVGKVTAAPEDADIKGLYLSRDYKTATLIYQGYRVDNDLKLISYATTICSYDVSDPSNMTLQKEISISGHYVSSRMQNGKLLLSVDTSFRTKDVDFARPETYIPQITDSGNSYLIPMKDIMLVEGKGIASYTIISLIDEQSLQLDAVKAFHSYSGNLYVNDKRIYLHALTQEKITGVSSYEYRYVTKLACVRYDDLSLVGEITLDGILHNEYCIDEYNGILRAVTEIQYVPKKSADAFLDTDIDVSLTCIDISTLRVIGSLERFSKDSFVESVSFIEDMAYVRLTKPSEISSLIIDLSDMSDITYKNVNVISGKPSSLVNFGNGYMMTIGRGESGMSLVVSIYKMNGSTPILIDTHEISDVLHYGDYEACYIDRDNRLIGIPIHQNGHQYLLLHFNGKTITEAARIKINGSEYTSFRGLFANKYFYIFNRNGFNVFEVTEEMLSGNTLVYSTKEDFGNTDQSSSNTPDGFISSSQSSAYKLFIDIEDNNFNHVAKVISVTPSGTDGTDLYRVGETISIKIELIDDSKEILAGFTEMYVNGELVDTQYHHNDIEFRFTMPNKPITVSFIVYTAVETYSQY